MDYAPAMIFLKDAEGRYLLANRTFERTFGISADAITGKAPSEVLPRNLAESSELQDLDIIRTRLANVKEEQFSLEGEEHFLLTNKFPILDASGNLTGIGAIASDITERKRAEESLREAEALVRALVEHSPVALSIKDLDGRYTYVSPAYTKYLGLAAEEAVGRSTSDILPPDVMATLVAADEIVLSTGEPLGEDESFTADFGPAILLVTKFPIHDDNNEIIGIGTVGIDITEQRQAEERLRQAQKMEAVGQLTGGVAHDFNNLLAVIVGNTELLEDRLGSEAPPLQAILKSATRGAELTQRLLAFSRRQPLRPRRIDLADLLAGMSGLLQRTLGATIAIETLVAPDPWPASADPGQVENALLNLAINARDAMPGGGKLTVECANVRLDEAYVAQDPEAAVGDYVVLAVSDTGTGMTPAVRSQAFEPFFTTKDVGEGSGLGLSMVYGFAKQSGGHVTIYSEAGRGTTVKLYLPRAEQASKKKEPKVADDVPQGQGEIILVIEDDAEVRSLAVAMLDGLGYRAIDVPDAKSAEAVLERGDRIDLVLSDVVLPGGRSGPDFAEEIRSRYPALKVVFMSGYPAAAAMRNGFVGSGRVLLNKPFRRQDLAKILRAALN
jgi:PAS domain S-box-containing protein